MELRRPLQTTLVGSLASLLLLAAPAEAFAGGEDDCACGACEMAQGDVSELLSNYLEGVVPASFCKGLDDARIEVAKEAPAAFYGELIAYRKDVSYAVDALVTRYDSKKSNTEERARLLDLAAFFPKRVGPESVATLWNADSKAFSPEHLVTFGEAGPEELRAAIEKRAKKEVLPAAFLALRGDDRGVKVLRKAVKSLDLGKHDGSEAALAAFALSKLGDEEALRHVRTSFEEAALAALDEGQLERARELALAAEFYCKKLVHAGKGAQLGWLSQRADWHVRERAVEVADAEGVFGVIEGLRG